MFEASTRTVEIARLGARPEGSRRSAWFAANTVALVVAAVALRIWHLGNIPGVNGDEAWMGVQSLRLLDGQHVAWQTPNGNLINPFFFLPLVVLHTLLPPSFALLRAVSLASGLAALVVNYILCRKAFDARTASVSTLVLALLPINIAYSRFAWDASQSLLATLVVMYLPLVRWKTQGDPATVPKWGVAALAAAILIHPTNVFAAVLLVMPALYSRRQRIAAALQAPAVGTSIWQFAVLVGAGAAAAYAAWYYLAHFGAHLRGTDALALFAQRYLELFSGTTIYEFISGAGSGGADVAGFAGFGLACDVAFSCVALAALWGLVRRLQSDPTNVDAALVAGWLVMLCGFFIVAGPQAIAPHYERYGICLIAPGALVASRGLAWWLDEHYRGRKWFAAALAMGAWAWLASFTWGYFEFIEQTGGRSHRTFRTAPVEPKLQALRYMLERRPGTESVTIVCREYWNYWPLAYLALGQDNVRVVTPDERPDDQRGQFPEQRGSVWYVEFAESAGKVGASGRPGGSRRTVPCHAICDYAGRELLWVIGPWEDSLQEY